MKGNPAITSVDTKDNFIVGNMPSLESESKELLKSITEGESNGKTTIYFKNEEDLKNGIAKVNIDLVSKRIDVATDVLFILDESPSMNSYPQKNISYADMSKGGFIPCQNRNHYYKIEKGKYGATEDIYFKLSDFLKDVPDIYNDWIYALPVIESNFKLDFGEYLNSDSVASEVIGYFVDNHYHRNTNGDYENVSQAVDNSTKSTSPSLDNPYGCYDRMTTAHQGVIDISQLLFDDDKDHRVGIIGFGGSITDNIPFTNDIDKIKTAMENVDGINNTYYSNAFSTAKEMIDSRDDKSRGVHVIFISDGKPTDGFNLSNTNYQYIRNLDGVHIHTVNVMSENEEMLKEMAYPSTSYSNCKSVDAFADVMNKLGVHIKGYPNPVINEKLDDVTIKVNNKYPVTIGDKVYKNIYDIPSSLATISDDGKTITFKPDNVYENGIRISYYVQLDNYENGSSGEWKILSNESSIEYVKLIEENGALSSEDHVTVKNQGGDEYHFESSYLTAKQTSSKMNKDNIENEDNILHNGDKITYYLKVKNNGSLNVNDVFVRSYLPEKTNFVKADNAGKENGSYISWVIPEIKSGASVTLSYTVQVDDNVYNKYVIESRAYYEIIDPNMSGKDDYIENISKQDCPRYDVNSLKNIILLSDSNTPTTYDDSNLYIYSLILLVSCLGICLSVYVYKRNVKRRP